MDDGCFLTLEHDRNIQYLLRYMNVALESDDVLDVFP
jgi:hypothetical protein